MPTSTITLGMGTVLALLLVMSPATVRAASLKVQLNEDLLHVEAPDLHFLSAEALQRLHDGATVIFAFRLSASATKSGDALVSGTYHCVFSYDIFEEKYKVSRLEPGFRPASHLSESAARDLCIDSLSIPVASLAPSASFWISIEYRMEEAQPAGTRSDSHSILDSLVDIFSQRSRRPQQVDALRGGPFRLEELRKSK